LDEFPLFVENEIGKGNFERWKLGKWKFRKWELKMKNEMETKNYKMEIKLLNGNLENGK
jgi:hypothetical protein